MKLYIAGGASEHGRNSFLVEGKSVRILVDCGLMREPNGSSRPFLSDEQIKSIDYLFLTHCHADHAGAVMWLYERGFRGIVVASRFTLDTMPGPVRECLVLEELGKRGTKITLDHGLSVIWGRSGHCMGSVWLLFSAEGKIFLFSGDYVEKSVAYKCDKIRDVSADLAVIDTAYGTKGSSCRENLKSFRQYVSDEYASMHINFYPVPSHGRGLDVIRILIENGCEVYADEYLIQELRDTEDRKSWLRKGMIRASESDHLHPLMQFPIGYSCVLRARQRWQQGSGNYLKVKEYSDKRIVQGSAISSSKKEPICQNCAVPFCRADGICRKEHHCHETDGDHRVLTDALNPAEITLDTVYSSLFVPVTSISCGFQSSTQDSREFVMWIPC